MTPKIQNDKLKKILIDIEHNNLFNDNVELDDLRINIKIEKKFP